MDLNDLWQNHKRFILGIGAGLLVFLIGSLVIDSTWSVSTARGGIAKRAGEIRRIEAPGANDLSALSAECDRLTARLEELYKRMNFETRPEFVLPSNESPDLFYNRRRAEEEDKLVREARRQDIAVKATLGLPEFTPSGTEAIQRHLRALNVVDLVVSAAVEARVRGVDDIEVRDTKSAARSKGGFLDSLPIKFQITGNTAAIAAVLDLLTRPDRPFLSIEDAEIEVDPRRQNVTVLRLTVAALAIHPEFQLTEARR